MKKTLIFSFFLFLCTPVFAAVELDFDHNGAIDISKGGTNSTTISGAKATLGIPSTLSALAGDTTHRVVTDAQIGIWDSKQAALTAGTDYLTPTGSASGLTNFPATLATDSEVATAVSGKANTSSFASSSTFQAAYGWSPSGTFDTTADQTITGDWAFSSGLEASNISLNLGTLADLKIGNAQMVDDTKGGGSGDGIYVWSAKKVFDQLASKSDVTHTHVGVYQPTLVSGVNVKTINGQDITGSGNIAVDGGGYTHLSSIPYSDTACNTGQYGYYGMTVYYCVDGFWSAKSLLTAHSNLTPILRTLTVTPATGGVITCVDGDLSAAINCGNGNTSCTATAISGASITGFGLTVDSGYTGALAGDCSSEPLIMSSDKTCGASIQSLQPNAIFSSRFEDASDRSQWSTTGGANLAQSSTGLSMSGASLARLDASATMSADLPSDQGEVYLITQIRYADSLENTEYQIGIKDSAGAFVAQMLFNPSPHGPNITDGTLTSSYYSTFISPNTTYWIKLRYKAGVGNNGVISLSIWDGFSWSTPLSITSSAKINSAHSIFFKNGQDSTGVEYWYFDNTFVFSSDFSGDPGSL